MSYDEAHHKRSRVVVETPAARREVVESRTAYAVPERRGVSTGTVAIVAITAVVLTAIVAWALTRPSTDELNANVTTAAAQPAPTTQIVTVPVPQQQPVVVPAPATTTTTTQPIIVPVPSTTSSSSTTTETKSNGTDDGTIQSNIEKKFAEDPKVKALGIIISVIDGKVTLVGSVESAEMKARVESLAKVKGVKSVDNQIIISSPS
ncbi:MAG TPA: BON domain-containing protein [Pyrinomonadaceae bacterium]|nr:BON domain-containing protein [Pyrinomonadaceae bacterium]